MPNGYTADIYEGKDISFRDFILQCTRGFGVAVMQRDDPAGAPLITHYEPDTSYLDQSIVEYRQKLERLDYLNPSDESRREYAEAKVRWEERTAKNAALKARYEDWIEQVTTWHVPAELLGMKETILGWLEESLRHDCYEIPYPVLQSPEEWLTEQREHYVRCLTHATEDRAQEILRVEERNKFLKLLMESLGK